MRLLAMLDGTLAEPSTPLLRPDDLGATRGDGVFESILVRAGKAHEFEAHLDRMERSAGLMHLSLPERASWHRVLQSVVDAWNWDADHEMLLKLVCTRGPDEPDAEPTAYALASSVGADTLRKRTHGVAAVTLERGIDPDLMSRAPWLLLSVKSLSYGLNMAALREAESRGAEEVVFTANDGTVLEGPTSTVVIARGGALITPPVSSGILPGCTERALFREAEKAGWQTKVEPIPADELAEADGVWLTSAVRLITQVHTLNGSALPASAELHAELTRLYDASQD